MNKIIVIRKILLFILLLVISSLIFLIFMLLCSNYDFTKIRYTLPTPKLDESINQSPIPMSNLQSHIFKFNSYCATYGLNEINDRCRMNLYYDIDDTYSVCICKYKNQVKFTMKEIIYVFTSRKYLIDRIYISHFCK